jgi:hypothetical protein
MKNRFLAAFAVIGLLVVVAPVWAHHASQAEFDFDKPVTVTGTLTKIMWVNPHSYLYMNVKDANGKDVNWAFELIGPGGLRKAGLSREDRGGMKTGDTLTISGFAARDGANTIFVKEIDLPDGRKVTIWTNDPYAR